MDIASDLASIVGLGILIYLIVEVRALRMAVAALQDPLGETSVPNTDYACDRSGGWVIWLFQNGRWTLKKKNVSQGYAPGPPPSFPGRYEGQSVQQDAVRDPSNR